MNNVIFVVKNRWGSSIMSGYQISEQMNKFDLNTKCVLVPGLSNPDEKAIEELMSYSKSVIVFVKSFPENADVLQRMSDNNILIWWIEDNFNISLFRYNKFFSEIIFPTEYMMSLFKENLGCKSMIGMNLIGDNKFMQSLCSSLRGLPKFTEKTSISCVRDHWDPRLEGDFEKDDDPTICFIGNKFNVILENDMIDNITEPPYNFTINYEDPKFIEKIARYNFHFSMRDPNRIEFYFKMNAKISTAAILNAAFITTPDMCNIELLGNDYPYYIKKFDIESVMETLQYAKQTYKTDVWKKAMKMMESVKEKTSLENVCIEYSKILKKYL